MSKNKIIILAFSVFLMVGLVFVLVGSFMYATLIDHTGKIETTAIVTEINTYRDRDGDVHGDTYVKYEVDGKIYETELNYYSSSLYEGKTIDIYYDKDNPYDVATTEMSFLVWTFLAVGLFLVLLGIGGMLTPVIRRKSKERLKDTGVMIHAQYLRTELNTVLSVNGEHPYRIVCQWDNPEDGKTYLFGSENLWYDPSSLIMERNITTFPVYMNMNNKKYTIDLTKLQNSVVDLR